MIPLNEEGSEHCCDQQQPYQRQLLLQGASRAIRCTVTIVRTCVRRIFGWCEPKPKAALERCGYSVATPRGSPTAGPVVVKEYEQRRSSPTRNLQTSLKLTLALDAKMSPQEHAGSTLTLVTTSSDVLLCSYSRRWVRKHANFNLSKGLRIASFSYFDRVCSVAALT